MANQKAPAPSFDAQLILFRYFLHELGLESLKPLSQEMNHADYEGINESGNTYFFSYLSHFCALHQSRVTTDQLRVYDENICRHTRQIRTQRGSLKWKYYQYLTLLFTEMYLDRYFSDKNAFCAELNAWLQKKEAELNGCLRFSPYTPERLNKAAIMCATGSGKTLLMHINILQFLHYFKRARRINSRLSINKVIVLAPNMLMAEQHLEELHRSQIPAVQFEKEGAFSVPDDAVLVIDMNKLKEEGKVKTVSVDSFEKNNLVLVDEGHRGLSGNIWYDYRTRLSAEGFSFEYSATFKQALNANASKKDERALMEEYGKSIIMDYSYKHFHEDGYGKDYRIYNLRKSINDEQRRLYLTGCLLSFYQQMKLYQTKKAQLQAFHIEKPLLVFVGNRVTASTSAAELTDVEEILDFLNQFIRKRTHSAQAIHAVLYEDTCLTDAAGRELFSQEFTALQEIWGPEPDAALIYEDLLRIVFRTETIADEPRLHVESIKQAPGEIGLKIGEYGGYFGVINIGDAAGLMKSCQKKEIVTRSEEFFPDSLFQSINSESSPITILIGSRKFAEGWNSWRVSTMGLINFAKSEGSQAIQLFGRGVRLKGYGGCLKRSQRLDDPQITAPRHIEVLETLTIFGVKAQYMEDFKAYLELEGVPANDRPLKFELPVMRRFPKDRRLRVIRVKDGANFKKQARRLLLDTPDEEFLQYLLHSKTVIDCRSKVQTIDSMLRLKISALPEEHTLPDAILPYLDYGYIFDLLEQHKKEKYYHNISIQKERLMQILQTDGWYALIIPESHLKVDSMEKLEAAADYAVMALTSYMDKFYRFAKARWEAPLLEYTDLTEDDANFVGAYRVSYAPQSALDQNGDELQAFFSQTAAQLKTNGRLGAYEKSALHGTLRLLDLPSHLYTPLLSLKPSNLQLQASPVSLNAGEKAFLDLMQKYTDEHRDFLADKPLYLLRNKSKTGMGFFEAGNFYPDFILWIDTVDTQYISFIDPKGLLHIRPDDRKISFFKTIKTLEQRLAPSAGGKSIILNSFILSASTSAELWDWWHMDAAQREAKNVYTLDNPQCVARMIDKILSS